LFCWKLLQLSECIDDRVSFETSFDLKQPKLEPKLVSALSETKRLFRLFCFYVETESFDVSIEPKQTEDQPKQFDRERILLFFYRKFMVFPFFSFLVFFFFHFFRFVSVCFETVYFGCFASIPKQRVSMFRMNRNKQETHPNSLKESIFGYFSENLGLFRFVTKQFCLFRLFRYRLETPKQTKKFCFWFHETNQNKRETDLVSFCFGSKLIFVCFEDTLNLALCSPRIR
jgi:hypothetical protein